MIAESAYYTHSGKFNPIGLLLGLGAGAVAAVAVPYVYSYVILYLPFAGYISFALAALCGGGVGWVLGHAFRIGNVRNKPLTLLAGVALGTFALYYSWAVWVYAFAKDGGAEVTIAGLVSQPQVLWAIVQEINALGAWTMAGAWTPTGGILWALWGIEALLIFSVAALYPLSCIEEPFCESCKQWFDASEDVVRLPPGNPVWLQQQLEMKHFNSLAKLGKVKLDAPGWFRLDLHSCTSCLQAHTLSVKTVRVNPANQEGNGLDVADYLDHILLTSEQANYIRTLR